MMNYNHINKDTQEIISGPHHVSSTYIKKLTSCGNPELLDLSEYGLKLYVPEPTPPHVPTLEEIRAALELALDDHIEQVAAEKQYGTLRVSARASCIGYAGYPNAWQVECLKYAAWVEGCYLKAQQIMGEVLGGHRAISTEAELLAEMPPMEW